MKKNKQGGGGREQVGLFDGTPDELKKPEERFEPSVEQAAVIEHVMQRRGPLAVPSLAGTGKTTTVAQAAAALPRESKILACVFNKAAERTLQKRMPPGSKSQTLNSLGLQIVTEALRPTPALDPGKLGRIVEEHCKKSGRTASGTLAAVERCASLMKATLAPRTPAGVLEVASLYEIAYADDAEKASADAKRLFAADVLAVLETCLKTTTVIDYDDQVWFPHALDLPCGLTYTDVFVDEWQDLTQAQIDLVRRVTRNGATLTAIGDPNQAIYAFRGADNHAFDRFYRQFSPAKLGLTMTRRCPKAVVRLAQNIVPWYTALPEAPEGRIVSIRESRLLDLVEPGDFIVSRTNAPLIEYCLRAIASGRPATVLGRDVAAELRGVFTRAEKIIGKDATADAFFTWMEPWVVRELEGYERRKADPSAFLERIACVRALFSECDTVAGARERLRRIFAESDEIVDLDRTRQPIICASTHKAKGLEADRVFVLENTFRQNSKRGPGGAQEQNLYYVAITRAKRELVLATEDGGPARFAEKFVGRY